MQHDFAVFVDSATIHLTQSVQLFYAPRRPILSVAYLGSHRYKLVSKSESVTTHKSITSVQSGKGTPKKRGVKDQKKSIVRNSRATAALNEKTRKKRKSNRQKEDGKLFYGVLLHDGRTIGRTALPPRVDFFSHESRYITPTRRAQTPNSHFLMINSFIPKLCATPFTECFVQCILSCLLIYDEFRHTPNTEVIKVHAFI